MELQETHSITCSKKSLLASFRPNSIACPETQEQEIKGKMLTMI